MGCCGSKDDFPPHQDPHPHAGLPGPRPIQSEPIPPAVNHAAAPPPPSVARRDKPLCFVGIDFGTSRSGYAYALGGNKPTVQNSYPGEANQTPKTITALLYQIQPHTGRWQPVAWGMDAYQRYHRLPMEERVHYRYLTRFKLALLDDNQQSFPLPQGCPFNSIEIVSHFMSFLVANIYETLDRTFGNQYGRDNILWCLTVPARTTDKAKNRMRQVAHNVGMVPDPFSDMVMLVHEPEAAALTVREQGRLQLRQGKVFLVVDAGGGTVDITLHSVVERNGKPVLSEATHRDGLLAGSAFIDEQFIRYFFSRIGENICYQWYRQHPSDMIRMIQDDWENLKRNFKGNEPPNYIHSISLPIGLYKMLPQQTLQQLAYEQDGCDDRLVIPQAVMESLFAAVVERIIILIMEMVTRSKTEPDHILLVGGLGSSQYLYRRIANEFTRQRDSVPHVVPPKMPNIITPNFGFSAIVEGSVLHAEEPTVLYQRCSLMTYGVETSAPWEPGAPNKLHDPATNRYMTNKFFSKFVTIDQQVTTEDVFVKKFRPLYLDQTALEFDIYASEKADVKYTTDSGVHKVGSVTVPIHIPRGGSIEDGAVKVFIRFGMAEMIVQAVQERTNRIIAAKVDFVSSASWR